MTIELKPFDRNDWHAFSAESPSGGEPCLIGYAKAADDWPADQVEGGVTIIVDASGVGVHGQDAWFIKLVGYVKGKEIAESLTEPMSVANLLADGWTPCNFHDIGGIINEERST